MTKRKEFVLTLAEVAFEELSKKLTNDKEFVYMSEIFDERNWSERNRNFVDVADNMTGNRYDWNMFDDRKQYNMKAAMRQLDGFVVKQSEWGARYKVFRK